MGTISIDDFRSNVQDQASLLDSILALVPEAPAGEVAGLLKLAGTNDTQLRLLMRSLELAKGQKR